MFHIGMPSFSHFVRSPAAYRYSFSPPCGECLSLMAAFGQAVECLIYVYRLTSQFDEVIIEAL